MIHRYKNNGYNIVLDVNSGSVHVVDDATYEILPLFEEGKSREEIVNKLKEKYTVSDIEETVAEIEELKEQGSLFSEDIYGQYIRDFKKRKTVVKAMCLHIAHDCNLACKYCFAEEGEYHGRRALMSYE
ncbi:MAG: PqqD family peptide modification chaperone, partial [Lachnospiraceae bacterium]|nr:PqqD family peptide modification chaperone [Lachnospiraceae bacterium]